jgi:hypothetical protein
MPSSLPTKLVVIISTAVICLIGCASSTERDAFTRLNRVHKDVEAATLVGTTYAQFEVLVRTLAAEILVARDQVTSDNGKTRLQGYTRAIDIYGDSLTVWRARILNSGASAILVLMTHGLSNGEEPSYLTLCGRRRAVR